MPPLVSDELANQAMLSPNAMQRLRSYRSLAAHSFAVLLVCLRIQSLRRPLPPLKIYTGKCGIASHPAAANASPARLLSGPSFSRSCLCTSGLNALPSCANTFRVNRDWPNLSDWLLRAHAATRRAETASTSATSESTNGSRSAAAHGDQAVLGDDTPAAEGLAREPDHYVVLGVTVDATDKQLQQAYRMRSLKFHPGELPRPCVHGH